MRLRSRGGAESSSFERSTSSTSQNFLPCSCTSEVPHAIHTWYFSIKDEGSVASSSLERTCVPRAWSDPKTIPNVHQLQLCGLSLLIWGRMPKRLCVFPSIAARFQNEVINDDDVPECISSSPMKIVSARDKTVVECPFATALPLNSFSLKHPVTSLSCGWNHIAICTSSGQWLQQISSIAHPKASQPAPTPTAKSARLLSARRVRAHPLQLKRQGLSLSCPSPTWRRLRAGSSTRSRSHAAASR